ncbi:MAG TPA: AI-2E family transporter [Steroidobacteraceae bacterium]|nr:AI-2E family transporter [Steroidobacteraceae bacterium]
MEHYSSFYRRVFVLATVAILGYTLLRLLEPFRTALEWAAVLAFLLHPLHGWLTRVLRGRAGASAAVLTVLTPFVVVAPLTYVALAFAREVGTLVSELRGISPRALTVPALLGRLERYPVLGPPVLWVRHHLPITMGQIEHSVTSGVTSVLQSAASASGMLVLGVAGTLVGFFLVLFLLFFLLRDGGAMLDSLICLVPLEARRRKMLTAHLTGVLRAVIFGTVATAVTEGVLIGIGFALVALPSPVVFGVLAALASFIPAVGTAVVLVPAILYLAATGSWGATAFLTAWSLMIAVGEQFLRPLLTSRHGEVSTLAVFVGAIGGAATFGLIGIVLGPVLLSLIAALIAIAQETVVDDG